MNDKIPRLPSPVTWMVHLVVGIVYLAVMLGGEASARAEDFTPIIQSACIPEARIFNVDMYGFWDTGNFSEVRSADKTSLILQTLDTWSRNSIRCSIGSKDVVVRATNYHPRSASGTCSMMERAGFEFVVDNNVVLADPAVYGPCDHSTELSLEFTGAILKYCITTFPEDTPWWLPYSEESRDTKCRLIRVY